MSLKRPDYQEERTEDSRRKNVLDVINDNREEKKKTRENFFIAFFFRNGHVLSLLIKKRFKGGNGVKGLVGEFNDTEGAGARGKG